MTLKIEQSVDGQIRKVCIYQDTDVLRYSDVVALWQSDESFRALFTSLLRDVPNSAYHWETPPVTTGTISRPFEFVLIDSPSLASVSPDAQAFASYFRSDCEDNEIVSFANLGGDAFLIAPCPTAALNVYPHIASFTREAPMHQQHALWQMVGRAVEEHVSEQPLWVSTAGLGVFWLHVRLDSRPKYYNYRPYQTPP